jgi:hypothetical protein
MDSYLNERDRLWRALAAEVTRRHLATDHDAAVSLAAQLAKPRGRAEPVHGHTTGLTLTAWRTALSNLNES